MAKDDQKTDHPKEGDRIDNRALKPADQERAFGDGGEGEIVGSVTNRCAAVDGPIDRKHQERRAGETQKSDIPWRGTQPPKHAAEDGQVHVL